MKSSVLSDNKLPLSSGFSLTMSSLCLLENTIYLQVNLVFIDSISELVNLCPNFFF